MEVGQRVPLALPPASADGRAGPSCGARPFLAMVITLVAACTLVGGCTEWSGLPPGAQRATPASGAGAGGSGGSGEGDSGGSGGSGGSGESECQPRRAREPFGLDPDFGQSFPDLSIESSLGEERTVADVRCGQRLTLISVAAGWCGPCVQETPFLQELDQALSPEGIRVAQVMWEDYFGNPADAAFSRQWIDRFDLTFPMYLDPGQNTVVLIDGPIQTLAPLNVVVDESGKVLWAKTGIVPPDMEQVLRSLLETLE